MGAVSKKQKKEEDGINIYVTITKLFFGKCFPSSAQEFKGLHQLNVLEVQVQGLVDMMYLGLSDARDIWATWDALKAFRVMRLVMRLSTTPRWYLEGHIVWRI